MNTMKKKIVIAMVGISVLLSFFVLLYTDLEVKRMIQSTAQEQRASYLINAISHVQAEIDQTVHPIDHLVFFMKEMPPDKGAPESPRDYQRWAEAIGPYAESLFTVRAATETLSLYFVDSLGTPVGSYFYFQDTDQNGYLNKPSLASNTPDAKMLQYMKAIFYQKSGYWLPTTTKERQDPTEQTYWHYAMPIFHPEDSDLPFAILMLEGPVSLFAKHLPASEVDTNPLLGFYETGNHLIATTPFFPLDDLSVYSRTPVEETIDAATKYSFSIKAITAPNGIHYTALNKKLSPGWTVAYLFETAALTEDYARSRYVAWLMAGLFILITAMLSLRVADYLEAPLTEIMARFDGSDPHAKFPEAPEAQKARSDEYGTLFRAFDALSCTINQSQTELLNCQALLEKEASQKSVALRQTNQLMAESIERLNAQETALDDVNRRLKMTMKTVEDTRHQLMTAEKSASLKYLVSGVAHELNTPIGNTITLATFLDTEYSALLAELNSGSPTRKSRLTESVRNLRDSTAQLDRNIQQASRIIETIETMASAGKGGEIKTFELTGFIESLVQAMLAEDPRPLCLTLDSPKPLMVSTDPAKIAALIRPMVQNSLDHGFVETSADHGFVETDLGGCIHISLRPSERGLRLIYEDDGVGVSPADLPHIFTPFFTTRFGSHKGLGLNLAYNIAMLYFNGSLEVLPMTGSGLRIQCLLYTLATPSEAAAPENQL